MEEVGQWSIHSLRSHISLLLSVVPGSGSLTHWHPPQFPFSAPPCPFSFFPFFFPLHLLHLPYAFPGIWKGRRETKRAFVGNARDCQLHGSEERWSPVLLRSGSKSSEAWDSCVDPPRKEHLLASFYPIIYNSSKIPVWPTSMRCLDQFQYSDMRLALNSQRDRRNGKAYLMMALLSYFPSSLFSVLPVNTFWDQKMCYSVSLGGEDTREKHVH